MTQNNTVMSPMNRSSSMEIEQVHNQSKNKNRAAAGQYLFYYIDILLPYFFYLTIKINYFYMILFPLSLETEIHQNEKANGQRSHAD